MLGEGVVLEQRVEDGPGDQVLGEHVDGVVAVIESLRFLRKPGEELVELLVHIQAGSAEQGA